MAYVRGGSTMISENNSNSNRIMPYEETVLLSSHSNKRELFIKIQTYYSLFIVLLTGKKLHRRVNTLKFFSFKQRLLYRARLERKRIVLVQEP